MKINLLDQMHKFVEIVILILEVFIILLLETRVLKDPAFKLIRRSSL